MDASFLFFEVSERYTSTYRPSSHQLTFVLCLAVNLRARFNIDGNMFADYLFSTVMWPQVIVQMAAEMDLNAEKEDDV